MRGPLFYSKILLFGEYGIIKDSKGLSIPYNFYKGALKIDTEHTVATHKSTKPWGVLQIFYKNYKTTNPNW